MACIDTVDWCQEWHPTCKYITPKIYRGFLGASGIQYDTEYLTCSKKLMCSQLCPPADLLKQENSCETCVHVCRAWEQLEVTCMQHTKRANILWNIEQAIDSRRKCSKLHVHSCVFLLFEDSCFIYNNTRMIFSVLSISSQTSAHFLRRGSQNSRAYFGAGCRTGIVFQ